MAEPFQVKRAKIWKASRDSMAGFMVTKDAAVMAGSRTNFIAVNNTGIALSGKGISFNTISENQRHGGFFIKMNDFVQMIPKTIVTPIPSQIPYPPLGMITQMTFDLPFFLALVAGGAIAGAAVSNT